MFVFVFNWKRLIQYGNMRLASERNQLGETITFWCSNTQLSLNEQPYGRAQQEGSQKLIFNEDDIHFGLPVYRMDFIPKLISGRTVVDPKLVPEEEHYRVAIHCIQGLLEFAHYLKPGKQMISVPRDDFYIYLETSTQVAAFLRNRCGFSGEVKGRKVWMLKSQLISDENVSNLKEFLKSLWKAQFRSSRENC